MHFRNVRFVAQSWRPGEAAWHDDYSAALPAGWLWFSSLIRLITYSFLLWPGFALMALFYFFSTRVRRDIWYGRQVCVGSFLVASVACQHIQFRAEHVFTL
jgi:hypothetical protein